MLLPLVYHMFLESCEAIMHSLGNELGDRFEQSGGFVKVAFALLQVQLDICVDPVAAQVF
jgi:hypothetical protein